MISMQGKECKAEERAAWAAARPWEVKWRTPSKTNSHQQMSMCDTQLTGTNGIASVSVWRVVLEQLCPFCIHSFLVRLTTLCSVLLSSRVSWQVPTQMGDILAYRSNLFPHFWTHNAILLISTVSYFGSRLYGNSMYLLHNDHCSASATSMIVFLFVPSPGRNALTIYFKYKLFTDYFKDRKYYLEL